MSAPNTVIQNRAKVKAGLETSLGVERMVFSGLKLIQDEFGPDGQNVHEFLSGDSRVRFIGDVSTEYTTDGGYIRISGPRCNGHLLQ